MAGNKRASPDNLSANVSLSWRREGPFHIYYSRLSTADISDFSARRAANPLPIFPARISASLPDAFFPSVPPSLASLMWQNKPRPIRIKALKRSLMLLKVPLNWQTDNMSCVEAAFEWGDCSSSSRSTPVPRPPWQPRTTPPNLVRETRSGPAAARPLQINLLNRRRRRLVRRPCRIRTAARESERNNSSFPPPFLFLRTRERRLKNLPTAEPRMWRTGINAVPRYSKEASDGKTFQRKSHRWQH